MNRNKISDYKIRNNKSSIKYYRRTKYNKALWYNIEDVISFSHINKSTDQEYIEFKSPKSYSLSKAIIKSKFKTYYNNIYNKISYNKNKKRR